MFQEIIDYIGNTALKHIAVKSYKYQKRIMINQQNNHSYMQFIVEDNPYFQFIKTANVYTLTLNIDIIGQPKDDTQILEVQNDAFQVGAEIIAYIERDLTYKGLLSIYDFDFLSISHFTDDNSAGQRLTLELVVPNPVNLCILDDNFDEDNMQVEETDDIDLPQVENKSDELILTPIKLKKNSK